MPVRKIFSVQDKRLRQKSKPVQKLDKKVLKLIKDLEDTLKVQKDPPGVGLAAPQIGVFMQVFIIQHRGRNLIFINPQIVATSKETNDPEEKQKNRKTEKQDEHIMEGCLSLPHYYGAVQRALSIRVKYQVPTMEKPWKMENHHKSFTGFLAQIIQHEIDHLEGKVFVERLLEQKRSLFRLHGDHWHEVELV